MCGRNLHGYVAGQVLEVSWAELQDSLRHKVDCLDSLLLQHDRYLHRVLFRWPGRSAHADHTRSCLRCLLNSKAAPVMKIITDIFGTITRFSGAACGAPGEESWAAIQRHYTDFTNYSRFLYSLVGKLSARGYQPHLQVVLDH